MTSIPTGSPLTQDLYNRRNLAGGGETVSLGDIGTFVNAVAGSAIEAQEAFEALDPSGDSPALRPARTPAETFGADTMQALLAAQEETPPPPPTREQQAAERLERLSGEDSDWGALAREFAALSQRARENAEGYTETLATRMVEDIQNRRMPDFPTPTPPTATLATA